MTDNERKQLDDIMAEAYGYWPPARALILERFRCSVTEHGEPSDAQINAALVAFYGEERAAHMWDRRDAMRAALRAASAVTEHGENQEATR